MPSKNSVVLVLQASRIPGRRSHCINDVRAADFNGDGTLDAVTANYRERSISVLMGVGDGTFQPAVTTPKGNRLQKGAWVLE